MQCLSPIVLYDLGINKVTGKRILRSRLSNINPLSGDFPSILVPCGKCLACLDNRRKEWIVRLQLQLASSLRASYITLTYDNEHLPCPPLCNKFEVQRFIKRFRHVSRDFPLIRPLDDFKYFVISEYGDTFGRPHYHGILFGVDILHDSYFDSHGLPLNPWQTYIATFKDGYPVYTSRVLSRIWKNGFVSVDSVTPNSIKYVATYVTASRRNSLDQFYLFSQGIARDYFCDEDTLSDIGLNAFEKRFITVLGSSGKPLKRPVPRFARRYCERFNPELYDDFKTFVTSVAKKKPLGVQPHVVESFLKSELKREERKRTKNETRIVRAP